VGPLLFQGRTRTRGSGAYAAISITINIRGNLDNCNI